jgi:hypothetical protein
MTGKQIEAEEERIRAYLAPLDELAPARFRPPSPRRRPLRIRGARALAGLLLVVVAALAIALTPPGRGFAEELGHLVGIGDEPSAEVPAGEHAIVIGTGDSVRSFPFEVVATTNGAFAGKIEICASVQFPTIRGDRIRPAERGSQCLTGNRGVSPESFSESPNVYAAPEEFGPEGQLLVASIIPAGITPTITYSTIDDAHQVPAAVHVADLSDELGARLHSGEPPFRYFFAVLPAGVLEGTAKDPNDLTPASVARSLRRVHYSLRRDDGALVHAFDLGSLVDPKDPSSHGWAMFELMVNPPKGFEPAIRLGK